MIKNSLYYKFKNGDGKGNEWTLYQKVTKEGYDYALTFEFQRPPKTHSYSCGNNPFGGYIETKSWTYYEDMHTVCSKEEFEKELKLFMEDLNNYILFINGSP